MYTVCIILFTSSIGYNKKTRSTSTTEAQLSNICKVCQGYMFNDHRSKES